jgi:hypothetical protein
VLQSISQIQLTNVRPFTKYNVLLYHFNKLPLENSAVKSKISVFRSLHSTLFFGFAAMNIFTAAGTVINFDSSILAGLVPTAQVTICEQVSFVTLSVTVHPSKFFSGCRSPTNNVASVMYTVGYIPARRTQICEVASLEQNQITGLSVRCASKSLFENKMQNRNVCNATYINIKRLRVHRAPI